MQPCIFTLFILACMLNISQCRKGIDCYKCAHVSSVDSSRLPHNWGYAFDESCKHGTTPKAKFLYSCEREYPDEDAACAKLSISIYSPFTKTPIEIIGRSCLPAKLVKRGCNKVTRADLAWLLPGVPTGIINMLPQNTAMNLCACKHNKCNGGSLGVSAVVNRFSWLDRKSG